MSQTGTILPRRKMTPSIFAVLWGKRNTRLGATSSAVPSAATANRRSPSRRRTKDFSSRSLEKVMALVRCFNHALIQFHAKVAVVVLRFGLFARKLRRRQRCVELHQFFVR